MKKIVLSVLSLMIFTSCAQEEVLLNNINFQNTLNDSNIVKKNQNSNVYNNHSNIITNINKTDSNKNQQITIKNKVNIAQNYNTETILAGLTKNATTQELTNVAKKYNIRVEKYLKQINTLVISSKGQNVPELINNLSKEKIFEFVETDNIGTSKPDKEDNVLDSILKFNVLSNSYNDKYFNQQYGLKNINAIQAWQLATGKDVKVAVIDSGTDVDHSDLKNNSIIGFDAFSDKKGLKAGDASRLSYISNTYKHGSHVAGIIAAEANNKKGIVGVAYSSKIMSVKIFPDFTDFFKPVRKYSDGSDVTIVSIIADGIVWAVDNGAKVINMSLGLWEPSNTIEKAVKYALDRNVSVVVAAGNERSNGNRKNYLASINGVIAVGAVDENNRIAYFSNSGDYISVVAPGCDIISSVPSIFNSYKKMSGTSMAAPHVAGIVALMIEKFGDKATPKWVKDRLEKTATDLGPQGWDDLYGHGLVNAYRALSDTLE
ncbi:MAG: thermitase [Candidatus Sericytochromatia bacterium]|nr:MAG: thermitase [Candidatus Sericytochromatia bacterium]